MNRADYGTLLRYARRLPVHLFKEGDEAAAEEVEETVKAIKMRPTMPIITCLCGSTRFWKAFREASLIETMMGKIVLSTGSMSGSDDDHFSHLPAETWEPLKVKLDTLHFRKIELADRVLILNVQDYIGESTTRELNHARSLGKIVMWWEHPSAHAIDKEFSYANISGLYPIAGLTKGVPNV